MDILNCDNRDSNLFEPLANKSKNSPPNHLIVSAVVEDFSSLPSTPAVSCTNDLIFDIPEEVVTTYESTTNYLNNIGISEEIEKLASDVSNSSLELEDANATTTNLNAIYFNQEIETINPGASNSSLEIGYFDNGFELDQGKIVNLHGSNEAEVPVEIALLKNNEPEIDLQSSKKRGLDDSPQYLTLPDHDGEETDLSKRRKQETFYLDENLRRLNLQNNENVIAEQVQVFTDVDSSRPNQDIHGVNLIQETVIIQNSLHHDVNSPVYIQNNSGEQINSSNHQFISSDNLYYTPLSDARNYTSAFSKDNVTVLHNTQSLERYQNADFSLAALQVCNEDGETVQQNEQNAFEDRSNSMPDSDSDLKSQIDFEPLEVSDEDLNIPSVVAELAWEDEFQVIEELIEKDQASNNAVKDKDEQKTVLKAKIDKQPIEKKRKTARSRKNDDPDNPRSFQKPLWEFLLETLANKSHNPSTIKWLDSKKGTFKIVENDKLANLWTRARNRTCDLKYEYFARTIRHHYKKNELKRMPGKKLQYQFHPDFSKWRSYYKKITDKKHKA